MHGVEQSAIVSNFNVTSGQGSEVFSGLGFRV